MEFEPCPILADRSSLPPEKTAVGRSGIDDDPVRRAYRIVGVGREAVAMRKSGLSFAGTEYSCYEGHNDQQVNGNGCFVASLCPLRRVV